MRVDRPVRHLLGRSVCVGALAVSGWSVAAAAPPQRSPVASVAISNHVSTASQRYADSLLASVALPPGARRIASPVAPLQPLTGSPILARLTTAVRYYVVAPSIGVVAFAQSHFPSAQWQGTASTYDGGYHASVSFSAPSLCPNRHVAYCAVTYSVRRLFDQRQELRVDVAVVWLPVVVVRLPVSGVVTVTGFETISPLRGSGGAVRVTLTEPQVNALRNAVASLRRSPGGVCMEDSLLYRITVTTTTSGPVIWSATADECPGVLRVTSDAPSVSLNDRSCRLDRLVATFFGPHRAMGTKAGLSVCPPSW